VILVPFADFRPAPVTLDFDGPDVSLFEAGATVTKTGEKRMTNSKHEYTDIRGRQNESRDDVIPVLEARVSSLEAAILGLSDDLEAIRQIVKKSS